MDKTKIEVSKKDNPEIVICVHNALDDVKVCIESIYSKTEIDFNLIIVNDGSNKETSDYLKNVKKDNSNFTLIENSIAKGYTKSANIGLKAAKSEYVVLMNSDVIVTKGWLKQLIDCANSDSNIGLVGPISNAASWQSVPNRFDSNGDWAINQLPSGMSLDEYSDIIKQVSKNKYPKVQLLNGFCTLIKRKVFNSIGYLDENNFPKGYGEENDFCLRAVNANFELAIDDSTYIFHAKSKSFGHETRRELSKAGNEVLLKKYGNERLQVATNELKENTILKELRSEIRKELINKTRDKQIYPKEKNRIIFLLPVAGIAGGIHSVFQEVVGMRLLNVEAKIATWEKNKEAFFNAYSNIQNLEEHFYFFNHYDELIHYCGNSTVVIATINHSIFLLKRIYDRYPDILPAYYVQDYEPFFFEKGSEEWKIAYDSYTFVPEALLMAKTDWLCNTVSQIHNVKVEKVSPSLDTAVYYPNINMVFNNQNDIIKIVAMIRPSTPRRGAERTMRVLKRIKDQYNEKVEINIFGTPEELLGEYELELDFDYINWEIINREQVSSLLRNSHIFVDFSIYQAFGRTGLEAMACGCAVVLPERGGTDEYVVHEHNAILADTSEDNSCYIALDKLVSDNTLRDSLITNAINDSAHYSIKRAALSEILLFNKYLKEKKKNPLLKSKQDFSDADRFFTEDGEFRYDLVSVIVVLENDSKINKKSFESIIQVLRYGDELIIVNNCSPKSNQGIIKTYLNQNNVKVITLKEKIKKSDALELGVENSVNLFILFVDHDLILPQNLLTKLVVYTDKKHISAVAPLINMENSFQNISLYEPNKNIYNNVKLLNEKLEENNKLKLNICKMLSLTCLIVRREAFNRIKGFKAYKNFEYTELDFIWRLKCHGSSVGVALDSYCYKINSSQKKRKFDKTIEEDKSKLYSHLLECYGDENMLTPKQIWGIDNLNFESIKTNHSTKSKLEASEGKTHSIPGENSASIIILTYNSSKSIMDCVTSVYNNLRKNDEVIIVDNNSEDDTCQKVKQFIKGKEQFNLIQNDSNIGFSAGTNVGIYAANNPFIVLLNPDTIVSEYWLDNLIYHFNDSRVGAVGPISNYVAGKQKMELYGELNLFPNASINEVAQYYYKNNKQKSVETKLLIGFCIVLKKQILDKIGYLDENLFLGNDDLELSWRLRNLGYKLKVATDTFIYHEGQQSFKTKPSSFTSKLVQESTDKLYEKLVNHYGENNVPTPMELWGINWFTPTNAKFNSSSKLLDSKTRGVSIVIPTFNQWEFTKQTIDSIKKFTDFDYEIIIIDNASTDNTLEELKKYKNIKVIANQENLGFPKAINQGILAAKGDYVLLLNNDVVVTKNWLNKMVNVIKMDENIGIVGPISNSVSGVQLDENAKYKSIEDMHKYAKTISEKNRGKVIQFPRVAFLCTLIKKEVIDKIGGLDERYTPGNFEDDDFCLRTQIAGFKTAIASDVFIHHYGSVSFKKNGENEYAKRLDINKQKFVNKWGGTPEEIWLQGKKYLKKEIQYPINTDLFNQSIARAFINIDDEEYDLAIENLNLALSNFDNSKRIGYENITREEMLNLIGTLLLSKDELEEARDYFEQELNVNPNSSTACFGLGEVFYKAQMYDESKTMYEWAVVNDENNKNAQIRLQQVNTKLNLPLEHNTVLTEANEGVE